MAERKAAALRTAAEGAYGARAFSRERENAMALLDSINNELGGARWFTRDDLLSVSAFGHVATITRYRYVSESVNYLLKKRMLMQPKGSRSGLALPGRGKDYETPLDLANRFMPEIKRAAMAQARKRGGVVSVADVLEAWAPSGGEAMAPNVRRAAIRTALRRMSMVGVLLQTEKPGAYRPAEN